MIDEARPAQMGGNLEDRQTERQTKDAATLPRAVSPSPSLPPSPPRSNAPKDNIATQRAEEERGGRVEASGTHQPAAGI